MSDTDRFRLRTDDLSWREIEGEVVVLDLRASAYLSLNPTGGVLWKRLEAGASVPELVGDLVRAFQIQEAQAVSDVQAFLDDCRARDLLIPVDQASPAS